MGRGPAGDGKKAGGHRVQRVEREIRDVIGLLLLGAFKNRFDGPLGGETPGIVSVSRVIVSRDLRTAKILVTVMRPTTAADAPARLDKKGAVAELQAHAHEFQTEVNRKLRMKHCPRLTFLYDDGFEHALKVENILRDLSKDKAVSARDEDDEDSVNEDDVDDDE